MLRKTVSIAVNRILTALMVRNMMNSNGPRLNLAYSLWFAIGLNLSLR